MRRKFVWDERRKELVEVPIDYRPPAREAPAVWGDIPEYVSPVTGKPVSGRKQRREDLRRSNSRPWEGMEQEQKEAARQREYVERSLDRGLEESARRALHQMDPAKRRQLGG